MLACLKLKFGSSAGQPNLEFDLTPLTVFVGPNFSGKSLILKEIEQYCSGGAIFNSSILEEIDQIEVNKTDAESILKKYVEAGSETMEPAEAPVRFLFKNASLQYPDMNVAISHFLHQDTTTGAVGLSLRRAYLRHTTLKLNAKGRDDLSADQLAGDLQIGASTTFQKLFQDDTLRRKLRDSVYEGLGRYLVLDPTNLGTLRMRFSDLPPSSPRVERGLDDEAVAFHKKASLVSEASDGAKAYVGVMTAIIAGDPTILLMDEPEAYLHPTLAFKMGKQISSLLSSGQKRMFVATHSSHFLMGCLQSKTPVNIVRLTYSSGVPTARLLESVEIAKLMQKPMLRSSNVMSALFCECVVVTESDTDRAFYQEINERLLVVSRGIENCLFLNAQGKHTIPDIVKALRGLGVPAAAIYDVDFVSEGGTIGASYLGPVDKLDSQII